MNKNIALLARIHPKVKALTDKWCRSQGIIISHFVEEALIDKLEENLDITEIQQLRNESRRPFEDVLKELKFNKE